MSKTENTRPIKVVEADPTTPHFTRANGTTVHLVAGVNSEKRYGKSKRKRSQRVVRQHMRHYLTNAVRLAHDPDLIDFPPIRAMYRSVGRRA